MEKKQISPGAYRVSVDNIIRSSTVLDGLCQIDVDATSEGSSHENPFKCTEHAPADQWHAFLDYTHATHYGHYGRPYLSSRSRQWNVNLLAFAHKFDVPFAFDVAKQGLEAGDTCADPFRPAFKLYLGQLYDIPEWIPAAAKQLAYAPLRLLTPVDYVHLGSEVLHILVNVHSRLVKHRHCLVNTLPHCLSKHLALRSLPNESLAWRRVVDKLAVCLFQDKPIFELDIVSLLWAKTGDASQMRQMTPGCAQLVLRDIETFLTGRDNGCLLAAVNEIITVSNQL
ncbi:hypothetical protein FRC09_010309 [Ceratobasidium sp. 395]|nr:hypothetical protein FRC09_010309 [Ceratobasidium sp. 395]